MNHSIAINKEEALYNLNHPSRDVYTREEAVRQLAEDPTHADLLRLAQALEDQQFGVRWEAAVQLANLGDEALPPLLHILVTQHESTWLREGAHHVCYYSRSARVRSETQALQKALRGPAAEVAAADAAVKLLRTWDESAPANVKVSHPENA